MKFKFYRRQKQFDGGMLYAMPQQVAYPQQQQPMMVGYSPQQPQKEEKMSTGKKIALGLAGLATAAGTAYAGYRGHLGAGIQKHLGTLAHKAGTGLGWNRLANSGTTTAYAALGREAGAFSKAQARDVQRFGLDSLRNKEGNLSMKNLNKFDEETMINRTNRQLGLSGDEVMSTNSVLINSGSRTSRGIGRDIDKNITTSTNYDTKNGKIIRYGDNGEKKILRDSDGNKYEYDSKKDVAKEYKENNNSSKSTSDTANVTKVKTPTRSDEDITKDQNYFKEWIDNPTSVNSEGKSTTKGRNKMSKKDLERLNIHLNDEGVRDSLKNYLTNENNIGKFKINVDEKTGKVLNLERLNLKKDNSRDFNMQELIRLNEVDKTGKLTKEGYNRLKNTGIITENGELHNSIGKTHQFEEKTLDNGEKVYYLKKI